MREIKFRGMTLSGDWVYGNLAVLPASRHSVPAGCYISNRVGSPFAYQVRPETVGQFTGLCDKNGKEIFEGDIVETLICFGPAGEEHRNITVTYDELGQISIQLWVFNEKQIHWPTVIGNIHQNPELPRGDSQ